MLVARVNSVVYPAVWISPINQNYEGPPTPYGDPYHGYWMADVQKLNSRFGTAEDLKALSAELHRRGMYAPFVLSVPLKFFTCTPQVPYGRRCC